MAAFFRTAHTLVQVLASASIVIASAFPIVAAAPRVSAVSPVWAAAAPAGGSQVFLVQGVPGARVDVRLDGRRVARAVDAMQIVGPLRVGQGRHTVSFRSSRWTVRSSFVTARPSADVVLHRPANASAGPVVTVFSNPLSAIRSGQGRLAVAHTAVLPPADVRAAGDVLFENIANGEFVTAEVPAGTYSVDIVPTGGDEPLLGPLDLNVDADSLTRVFAIGTPRNGSMNAIVQVLPLPVRDVPAMTSVPAGEAGLVATSKPSAAARSAQPSTGWWAGSVGVSAVLVIAMGFAGKLRFGRRHAP